jgi:hypothetical protein
LFNVRHPTIAGQICQVVHLESPPQRHQSSIGFHAHFWGRPPGQSSVTVADPPFGVVPLAAAIKTLERSGSRVEIVQPNDATQAALAAANGNVLDPAVRRPAAEAGRAQGRRLAHKGIASLKRTHVRTG